ncbi:MAG TPA: PAS domain S-box protein [Fimbriimonadaceae bacterium]|nr:PAS domain S-box protein [Fimbriimonadaceae bacterium]
MPTPKLSQTDAAMAALLGSGATDIAVRHELRLTQAQFDQALRRLISFVSDPVDASKPKALCERALRCRAEAMVRSLEARFHALMETALEAVLVVDGRSGIIREANGPAEELFGRSRSELQGLSVEELVPVNLRSIHGAYRLGFLSSDRRRELGRHPGIVALRPDGTSSTLAIALTSTKDNDDVMVVCTEYTRWKAIQGAAQASSATQ